MLLSVERGIRHRFVVNVGGVLVDGGSGLRAQVAVASVEVERADVVGAVCAGELHAAFDASDGVETFHSFESSPLTANRKARWWGGEGNERGR